MKLIEIKINQLSNGQLGEEAEFEDLDSLKIEADELKTNIANRKSRINEIHEKRKWNIDNICKVKEEVTIVNSANSTSLLAKDIPPVPASEELETDRSEVVKEVETKAAVGEVSSANTVKPTPAASTRPAVHPPPVPAPKPKGAEPSASIMRERMAVMTYNDFVIKHEQILETYSEIQDIEATKEYLFKHCDILLHEHSQSYMLLSCLEDEMNGKTKRMRLVCRQSQILSHIHELGVSMKRDPRDVVLPFFKRIEEKDYFVGFQAAIDDFIKKIQKRAVEKRKEMDAERVQDRQERAPPGHIPLFIHS